MKIQSFFSVSYDLIVLSNSTVYNLFVNSSGLEGKQKFIRIFPMGEELTEEDLSGFKKKYNQLYVSEEQRGLYMKSLLGTESVTDEEAVTFIKDSAVKHLSAVFDSEKEFTTEVLQESIEGCKDTVEGMIDVLDDYSIEGLKDLIGNLSGHDFYTYDHSINVSMYSITILKLLRPESTKSELTHIGLGALLHDLGKTKISTEIINSISGLSAEEFAIIKTHPDLGLGLLNNEILDFDDIDLKVVSRVVHEHHENWDGKGYPQGLKEKEIHLFARICAVADFFDAITTKRSYADVLGIPQALALIGKTVGKKIDPKIFKVFASHITVKNMNPARNFEISDDFDPCMPHASLPITEITTKKEYGKIQIMGDKPKVNKRKEE